MQTTDLRELKEAVEHARRTKHPDLPSDFLDAVISAEERFPEDDQAALTEIRKTLDSILLAAPEGD